MTRIGWCPGGRPVADMLKLYPEPGAVRLFYGFRDPVPTTWGGPDLDPLGPGVLPVVSFKVWNLPAMLALAGAIPPGVVVGLSYHHEDEQQDGGDIPPELFVSRWVELARAFEGHPKRDQIILAPIFTRYWWQAHPGDLRYWPAEVAHLLDAVGWDVYNNGSTYRTPDDLLRIPREMAARTGLPYFVGELGAVDVGPGRSEWMRAMVAAARADGALAVCWFHKDEWDLTRDDSVAEQQTWRELIGEAATVAWYLNHALTQFREAVNAAYPNRDKTSDGTVGDLAHQATNSDHNPDPDGSVDAWDMDVDLRCGDDPAAIEHLKQVFQRHESSRYWIHNRQIASRSDGWVRRYYDGPNPHDHHVHWNTREGYEASAAPWQLGDDMTPEQFVEVLKDPTVAAMLRAMPWQYKGGGIPVGMSTLGVLNEVVLTGRATAAKVGADQVDEAAIVAGVLAGLTPEAIAAAIPAAVAKQVADELSARLAG